MTDEDLLDRHEERLGEMSRMYAGLAKRVSDLEDELERKDDRIAELEDLVSRLRDIGSEKTSREEKIVAFVTYADRMRDDRGDKVAVLPKRMRGVAGISERYAYQLIDDLHEDDRFPWLTDAAADGGTQRALLVDFGYQDEPVQPDAEPLNKFINASTGLEGPA